jgi:hypothetical protein
MYLCGGLQLCWRRWLRGRQLVEASNLVPSCPDCDAKWARATAWVTENSGLKIQSKSDAQIKTEQAAGYVSRTLVVTITKNATSKPGIYEISFVGGCPSSLSCVPPVAESRAGFVAFVLVESAVQRRPPPALPNQMEGRRASGCRPGA